jgi:hypothetical protein
MEVVHDPAGGQDRRVVVGLLARRAGFDVLEPGLPLRAVRLGSDRRDMAIDQRGDEVAGGLD